MSYRSRLYNHRNAQSQETVSKKPFFAKQHEANDANNKSAFFQPKLSVNDPGDQYEHEADGVANAVVNNKSAKPIVKQGQISNVQRLATSMEDEKLGTNDARMERDKEDKVKAVQRAVAGPEKEKEKPVQKMGEPQKEKDKKVQKKDEPKKEEEKKALQRMTAAPEKEKEKPVQKMGEPEKEKDKKIQKKDEPKKEEEKKGIQKATADPEKEKDKHVQKMGEPDKEKDKMAQKKDEPEKEVEKKDAAAPVQKKPEVGGSKASQQVSNQIENSAGKGNRLPASTLKEMNSSFGYDFSDVRVHKDSEAANMNKELNAQAFTHGNDIYFNSGKFNPEHSDGKLLLAHELTHVLQQKPDLIMRECLNGAVCKPPIAGAPGQFVEQEEARQEPAQKAMEKKADQARKAAAPRKEGDPAPAEEDKKAMQDIEKAKHGERAKNLEKLAADNGISFSGTGIAGIFIDSTISPNYGAVTRSCSAFKSFVNPPTADPNMRCTFVSVDLENEAGKFYSEPKAATIGKFERNLWLASTLSTLSHERQHAMFDTGAQKFQGKKCARNTVLYKDAKYTYTVQYYLSELNAILSEFLPFYNVYKKTGDEAVRKYVVDSWLKYKVETAKESIKGILTTLKCKCDCGEVDNYIRDTFMFVTSGWPLPPRVILNTYLANYPGLDWPLKGGEPKCLEDCMDKFNLCTKTSATGGMTCLAERSTCMASCD